MTSAVVVSYGCFSSSAPPPVRPLPISSQRPGVGHLLVVTMKSQDVSSLNLLPTTFSTSSLTDSCASLAYPSLPPQQLMPLNFLLNPSLFSSFMPSFPVSAVNGLPVSTLHLSLGSQQPSTSLSQIPHLFEQSTEGCSQSSECSQATESGMSSPRNPSPVRVSSVESCSTTTRIRRGRPQQEISDEDDPSSQKRRHRRLYARQYRAQMRHKVDEVKVLSARLEEMQRTVERLEAALESERREHHHKTVLLNSMIQSKLLP
ncbi:hypothetical protein ANCCAN_22022 [Ancylostoma caninum]|uniref:BZIP domain-containing protein n=1 Tax=Ancylostoma caninum TaxID=29170 RepID=A0A368FJD9_ANCCA|nr:hypothetical protein ANCCAN_22022 [Ancylostoma caninum]